MRVLQFPALDKPLELAEIDDPKPKVGEVVIDLRAAAFNRRDYWISKGLYPGIAFPLVPGSDGAGLAGEREVVIDAGIGWGDDRRVQADTFHLIGSPGQGTFAEKIAVPRQNLYDKPAHLTWEEAACLPVAGVTAYRALFTRGGAKRGEKLLITGGGGGVAVMTLLFARAAGLEAWVTTGSREKIGLLKDLGAEGGVIYKKDDWPAQLKSMAGQFDIVIDGTAGDAFAQYPKLVRPGGRVVVYGGTAGKIRGLSPQVLFWRQIDIRGTSMGSPQDFADMIAFVDEHKIRPQVDSTYTFETASEAMETMAEHSQIGKLVLRIPT